MLAIITKANDDFWYKFKEVKTIEDVIEIYPSVVIEKNTFSKEEARYWDGFKKEDISLLEKAKIHIIIYNSWIE